MLGPTSSSGDEDIATVCESMWRRREEGREGGREEGGGTGGRGRIEDGKEKMR